MPRVGTKKSPVLRGWRDRGFKWSSLAARSWRADREDYAGDLLIPISSRALLAALALLTRLAGLARLAADTGLTGTALLT